MNEDNKNPDPRKKPEEKPDSRDRYITIIVNAREKKVGKKEISFGEVVRLAFADNPPTGEFVEFTVTYRKAAGDKPDGILKKDKSVAIKDGTAFHVTSTDKS